MHPYITPETIAIFWSKVVKTKACWLWTWYFTPDGYGQMTLGNGHAMLAHRFSFNLHRESIDRCVYVKQTCGNNGCVNPDHLVLSTHRTYTVPSFASVTERFWSRVDKASSPYGCWLWTGLCGSNGYGHWYHYRDIATHRFSYKLAYGNIPDGLQVCHSCDKYYPVGDTFYRRCVRPDHLWLGTHTQNVRDMVAKGRGRVQHGEMSSSAKLTDNDVREIRRSYATGTINTAQLGHEYGVDQSQINRIVNRKGWAHIE